MAREITQRQRAEALYGSLTCTTYREGYQDPDNDIGIIEQALTTARQEALRDVLTDLDALHWKDHWYAEQLRRITNDRLAREGVK